MSTTGLPLKSTQHPENTANIVLNEMRELTHSTCYPEIRYEKQILSFFDISIGSNADLLFRAGTTPWD